MKNGWVKIDKNIEFKNNELMISEKRIKFQYNIVETKATNNLIFVRFKIPVGRQLTEKEVCNVVAINKFGDVEWQINNVAPQNNPDYICSPMVGMDLDINNMLYITDFMGRKFQVNQENVHLKKFEIVR